MGGLSRADCPQLLADFENRLARLLPLWQRRQMLGFHEIDMMVRGGSLALMALWSWLLLRDHGHAFAARMAVAMNVAIACHIVATVPGPVAVPVDAMPSWTGFVRFADWLVEFGSVSVPPLFWLFTRAWFNDEQRFGWLSWASLAIGIVCIILIDLSFHDRNAIFTTSVFILRASMVGFGVVGLWIAWRGRDDDLVESRRRLRTQLVVAVGVLVILTNGVEIAVFQGFLHQAWRSILQVAILGATFGFCGFMFGPRLPDLLAGPRMIKPSSDAKAALDDPLAARLLAFMDSELPHRDEEMTIAKLAHQLGDQEYRLRRLINGGLGHRNFAQFLNGYRLAEVKSALADPDQAEVPILTIALDAGFGSLGPFNRAFREAEGVTPSAFRARVLLADSGIG